jgi:hypothetical protein
MIFAALDPAPEAKMAIFFIGQNYCTRLYFSDERDGF